MKLVCALLKEFTSPGSATSGLAGYGQEQRARLLAPPSGNGIKVRRIPRKFRLKAKSDDKLTAFVRATFGNISADAVAAMGKFDPEEARDDHGRWVSGAEGAQLADRMMNAIKEKGGFTIDYRTKSDVSDGFAVGVFPSRSASFDKATITNEDVSTWLSANKSVLSDPRIKIGGWVDDKTGKVWLDMSRVYPREDKSMAVAVGTKLNQISIADLGAISRGDWDHAFIETGGTGAAKADAGKRVGMRSRIRYVMFDNDASADEILEAIKNPRLSKYDPDQPRDEMGRFADSLGIQRKDMPQIRESDQSEFIHFAHQQGVSVTRGTEVVGNLKPAQNEYNPRNVASLVPAAMKKPIMISADNYILDGTHRYLRFLQDDPKQRIDIVRVNLPARQALALMASFPKSASHDITHAPHAKKGDYVGHDFHGNQWTGGMGGMDTQPADNNRPQISQHGDLGAPSRAEAGMRVIPSYIDQTQFNRLTPQAATILRGLYADANAAKPAFDAKLQQLAEEHGGAAVLPPLKGSQRAVDKILTDYQGDATQIKDLLRGTILVDSAASASAAVASARAVKDTYTVSDKGFRNLFDTKIDPVDGYRDAKMNVRIGSLMAEIQVNIPKLFDAKLQVHDQYQARSAIEQRMAGEFRKNKASPAEAEQIDGYNRAMRAVYVPVWEGLMSAKKALFSMGAPFLRADSGSKLRAGSVSQARQYQSPTPAPMDTGIPSTSKNSARLSKAASFIVITSTGIVPQISLLSKAIAQDGLAQQAATSPFNLKPHPTVNQAKAGNYPKGHIKVAGLDISIENPSGSKRRPEWPTLQSNYGYIRRTLGADGDQVDCFVRNGTKDDYSGPIFVIDQHVGGWFDEHKVMIGWHTETEARSAYQRNFTPDWTGLKSITQMSIPQFKAWLADGNMKKPVAKRDTSTEARDYHGRFTAAGVGSGAPGEGQVTAFEAQFANAGVEHAFAVDSSGKSLLGAGVGGTAGEVQVPLETLAGKNAIFTHNHVNDVSLSGNDLAFAASADLKQIRAVGSENLYVVTRGPQGWPASSAILNSFTQHKAELDRQYPKWDDWAGSKNPTESSKAFQHELVTRVANDFKGHMTYERHAR